MNVVQALSQLHGIEELDVNLDTKSVKIKLNGNNISREIIENIVEQSIVKGKVDGFSMFH